MNKNCEKERKKGGRTCDIQNFLGDSPPYFLNENAVCHRWSTGIVHIVHGHFLSQQMWDSSLYLWTAKTFCWDWLILITCQKRAANSLFETAGELKTSIDPESIPCVSNLIQPQAANCQLSLLTGYKSVANVNYNRSLPLPQRREEKTKSRTVENWIKMLRSKVFKHFISHAQQFNIGPILFWFLSGPHEIDSRAAGWKALIYTV